MILQVIFTISHGQASVERGFSANKNLLVENVEELAIQSCLIKDSLTVWIYLTKRCSMLKMLDRGMRATFRKQQHGKDQQICIVKLEINGIERQMQDV